MFHVPGVYEEIVGPSADDQQSSARRRRTAAVGREEPKLQEEAQTDARLPCQEERTLAGASLTVF